MPLRYLPQLLEYLLQEDAREKEAFPEYEPRGRGEWYINPEGSKGWIDGKEWPYPYSSQMRMRAPRVYPDNKMVIDPDAPMPLPMSREMYQSLLQFFGRTI